MNNFKENIDSNKYFKSLPSYIQETIKQASVDFNSEDELKKFAENLMNKS